MGANLHPRLDALLARLRHVGDTQMRELPLYHAALAVEGVGFRICGDALVGVIITPWFINAIRLPLQRIAIDWSEVGRTVEHRLPCGPVAFRRGGDEVIGQYDALSLHSPVSAFENQEMARREAEARMESLFEPPLETSKTGGRPQSPSRRAFLRGGASGP